MFCRKSIISHGDNANQESLLLSSSSSSSLTAFLKPSPCL